MIPKIITGNKYGKVVENASRSTITDKLMTLANLEQVYACNYFVPTNTLGVELLSRTVTLKYLKLKPSAMRCLPL